MPHIFDQKCFCNLDLQKCREYDKEEWLNQIQQKPKLRTYILFKSLLETEFYVTCLPKSQRSVFSKLRCGVLPLKIETGRFNAIDRENRICEFCSLNEVEDEQHFVCRCTLYNDLRVKMYHSAAAIKKWLTPLIHDAFAVLPGLDWSHEPQIHASCNIIILFINFF